jgi:inosose dehydratase
MKTIDKDLPMNSENHPLRVGCQTYTWEMHGKAWHGSPDDILDAIAAAGYAGVEFSNNMIGDYYDRPEAFEKAVACRGLVFVAFACSASGFTDPKDEQADLAEVERGIRLAAHFSVPLCLGGPCNESRDNYDAKLIHACGFYAQAVHRAGQHGVTAAVHPNSHHTSLVMSPAEYDRFMAATAGSGLQYNPDTGHLIRGGCDVLTIFKKYRDRIVHVHLKDVDAGGNWQPLGQGVCNLPALLDFLRQTGYDGWMVAEEESHLAWQDPNRAITVNREALRAMGC